MTPKIAAGTAALIATALALSACSTSPAADAGSSGDEYIDGGTFSTALTADPGNLNPLIATQQSTITLNRYLYDRLVNLTPEGEIVSNLATAWEVSADSITFTLHPDITCSDGTPFTAEDAAANLEWIADPANASPQVGYSLPDRDFTVDADNASRTLTITLGKPFGFFLYGMTQIPMVCASGLSQPDALAQSAAGTGPYVLSEVTSGSRYVMTARDDYAWGPDGFTAQTPGAPETVILSVVADQATATNLLLSGDLNAAAVSESDRERATAAGLFEVQGDRPASEVFFNHDSGHATADADVRVALAMALDMHEVMTVVTGGTGSRPKTLEMTDFGVCREDIVADSEPAYDPAAAGDLLDGAGWALGADGIRNKDGIPLAIDFVVGTSGGAKGQAAAELIAESWRSVGADVALRPMDINALISTTNSDDWDATIMTIQVPVPPGIVPFVSGPHSSDGGLNFSRISNDDFNALAAEASVLPWTDSCGVWAQAQANLIEDADLLAIALQPTYIFGNGAEFDMLISPTSIRLTK